MSARTNPFSVIRCGNAEDAHRAYIAMFRYAFGRQTGMPGTRVRVAAAIPYAVKANWRMMIYWLAAATPTACATYTGGKA